MSSSTPAPSAPLHQVLAPVCLRTEEAARLLGVSVGTLKAWRMKGKGPRYSKLGAVAVYTYADLEAFVVEQRVA